MDTADITGYKVEGLGVGRYRNFGQGMTVVSRLDQFQGRAKDGGELGEWARRRIEERKAEAKWKAERKKARKKKDGSL